MKQILIYALMAINAVAQVPLPPPFFQPPAPAPATNEVVLELATAMTHYYAIVPGAHELEYLGEFEDDKAFQKEWQQYAATKCIAVLKFHEPLDLSMCAIDWMRFARVHRLQPEQHLTPPPMPPMPPAPKSASVVTVDTIPPIVSSFSFRESVINDFPTKVPLRWIRHDATNVAVTFPTHSNWFYSAWLSPLIKGGNWDQHIMPTNVTPAKSEGEGATTIKIGDGFRFYQVRANSSATYP